MESLELLLLIVHIVSAIFIVMLVLLQPSSGDGGLVSSYGGNPLVSPRTKANILSKATKYIMIIFMANVLLISWIQKQKTAPSSSVIQELVEEQEKTRDVPLAN